MACWPKTCGSPLICHFYGGAYYTINFSKIKEFLAVFLVNCGVTCLSLILDVQLYDSGVGKDKSLALEPKIRAKTKDNIINNHLTNTHLSTFAQTCAFCAKIVEKNFGNCHKPLRGKEIIFLFFWRIAR